MSTSATEPSDSQGAPAPSTPQLTLLLELQEADLALDRLAYRHRELAERVAVSELGARVAGLPGRVPEAQDQRDKLASQQLILDQRSEAVGGRIATIEQRLNADRE